MPNARKKKAAKMEDFKVTAFVLFQTLARNISNIYSIILGQVEKEAQGRKAKDHS